MNAIIGQDSLSCRFNWSLARALVVAGFLFGFLAEVNDVVGQGIPVSQSPLDSWSFYDTKDWTSDYGYAPVSFANLNASYYGFEEVLILDSTNAAWLQYNVVENDGTTNLTVDQGSVMLWFAPSWSGTNAGGFGPGWWGQLIDAGQWTTNASYGWWSLYTDPAGANLYFSAQGNDGSQTNYLSVPITWTAGQWHFIALTYSIAGTALYLDGQLATNGAGMSLWPTSDVLSNGFYIGSDTNGEAQAHGAFANIYTYNSVVDSNTINGTFNSFYPYFYVLDSWSFYNTTNWISDFGYVPISFTNLNATWGDGAALLLDSTNAAWLQYNVVENDGTTNLMVNQGSVTMWFAPDWGSTNVGGFGPGWWGQLLAIAQAGVMSDEFGYAADGARLWKRINQNSTNIQVWIGSLYEEKGGKVLYHVFAGSEQICTFETNSYLMGGSDSTKVGYYYHQDNLNSSSALSDHSGNRIEVDSYYPFGRTNTASPQASFQISRRFTGQVFDAESGLYYYNARYYDPELGRFIQPDTEIPDLSNPQSYNRYSYCVNDPLRYNDPSGHDFFTSTPGDGNWGYVSGPVPYMSAKTTLGRIGASAYNVLPLVDNSIHQGLREVAAVDRAAGDVLQAGTQAAFGDPQLAQNARNLTLLVGGVGEIAKMDEAVVTAEKIADETKVVRGGKNLPGDIARGTGTHPSGVTGVSVESAEGKTVGELSANIPHGQVGVTTVGQVRAAGGDVIQTSGRSPNHATLTGLTPEQTSKLLTPTIPNPAKQ